MHEVCTEICIEMLQWRMHLCHANKSGIFTIALVTRPTHVGSNLFFNLIYFKINNNKKY